MIILDTHALIWALFQKGNIPVKTQQRIEVEERVLVSIVSFWEIAIKQSIGKIDLKYTISDIIEVCRKEGIDVLPIKPEHLDQIKELPMVHNDPFDRLIIAQAMIENLVIVTKDRKFTNYDVKIVWE